MTRNRLMSLIMLAVLAWGSVLSYGAYRQSGSVVRPLVTMGCVLAFLGFWLVMLNTRRRRVANDDQRSSGLGNRN
ncbi:MAG TPA: hypothetical protein VHC19_06905 [Pirellulales bacterium]|jgi:hypothetical protein|nr:hypothetical protein [Pirellulales bacterium]